MLVRLIMTLLQATLSMSSVSPATVTTSPSPSFSYLTSSSKLQVTSL